MTVRSMPRIPELGDYTLQCEGTRELLFTENESNAEPPLGTAQSYALCQGRLSRVRNLRRA